MKFTLFRVISCFILYFLVLIPSAYGAFSQEQKARWQEAFVAGKKFVTEKLSHAEGGVYSNYLTIYPADPNAGVNHEITSESMALLLNIAAESVDRQLFEKSFKFLKKYMVESSLVIWRLNEDLSPTSFSSSTIDDLLLIKGLLRGYEQFGEMRYKNLALELADALRKYAFRNGVLVDVVSWDENGIYTGDKMTFPFVDFSSMRHIARYVPAFRQRFNRTFRFIFRAESPWERDITFFGSAWLL